MVLKSALSLVQKRIHSLRFRTRLIPLSTFPILTYLLIHYGCRNIRIKFQPQCTVGCTIDIHIETVRFQNSLPLSKLAPLALTFIDPHRPMYSSKDPLHISPARFDRKPVCKADRVVRTARKHRQDYCRPNAHRCLRHSPHISYMNL